MHARSTPGLRGTLIVLVFGAMFGCKGADIEYGHEVKGEYQSTGRLENGKKHGPWTTVREGEITKVEYWRDGVLHGPSRDWDIGYMDWMFVDGKLHGRSRSFFSNGQIHQLEWFKKNKRDGMSCEWYQDGTLRWIRIHEMDRWMEEVRDPPGECPLVVREPRHLDRDDQDYR